jgi:peptidoglycan/LPS O-acetylase OafA/YrhL
MEKDRSRFYCPELDCLRFVAFLSVFVYHLDQQFHSVVKLDSAGEWMFLCIVKSGVFGVDLFFCLSSFLITILLLREYDLRGSIDVRAFWIRRILRIWPLYYVFLLLSAIIFSPWLQQQLLGGWRFVRYWFFLGNWDCVFHDWHHSPVGPLWSISVEEQFYLVWPLLLLAVKPKRLLPLAVVALIGANIYILTHGPANFVQQWPNTFYHVAPIAWGAIGAYLAHANRLNLSILMRSVLLMTGVCMIPAYFFCRGFAPFFDGKDLALYPISSLCCALVVVSLYDLKAVPWDNMFMKIWAYLGRISYGLYVFHMLALTIIVLQLYHHGFYQGEVIPMFSMLKSTAFAVILSLTILLAWLSYTFLETPFLKLKKKFTYIPSAPQTSEKDIKP